MDTTVPWYPARRGFPRASCLTPTTRAAPIPGCAKSINLVEYAAAMDPVTTIAPRAPEAADPAPIRTPLRPGHFVDHGNTA